MCGSRDDVTSAIEGIRTSGRSSRASSPFGHMAAPNLSLRGFGSSATGPAHEDLDLQQQTPKHLLDKDI